MKPILLLIFLTSLKGQAQTTTTNGTLLQKENVRLALDNSGIAVNRFVAMGDIHITQNLFIFRLKPYRKKRYRMNNDLVEDIALPYDSIIVARKIVGGLMLMTNTKKYIMGGGGNWKAIVLKINQLRKQHKAK